MKNLAHYGACKHFLRGSSISCVQNNLIEVSRFSLNLSGPDGEMKATGDYSRNSYQNDHYLSSSYK